MIYLYDPFQGFIPLSLGFCVMDLLSLPLESEISLAIYDLLDL